jgi:hypothetical protein
MTTLDVDERYDDIIWTSDMTSDMTILVRGGI